MPVYPTYFPQMNNGYNQQMQNPYQQRMDFLQSYQQSLQQPVQQMPIGINGKIVPSAEMITANDVPMDGSVAVFPKQDMSEIYVKFWENNGTIRTIVFKPLLEQNPNKLSQTEEKLKFEGVESVLTGISEKVDNVLEKINEITAPQKPARGLKKESSE